ncbi:NrdH-like glutaredoxin [Mycobacterium phage Thonko]|uniref:NrdH-like glutaredoxin n=1 Tax=Mycobacterium phage Thonko TaxID=2282910 RepID=A0A346FCC7_9CAUD|nr:NrdH-like glutaredoxin [Mycobacterium phage Thonko]AXN53352.1 NrdH-like glutaredoxin [Mycobacterium phage Thonko]
MYSTGPACYKCNLTKRQLDKREIAYEERPADSAECKALIDAHGFTSAPVVVAPSGDVWDDYRPDRIDALLALARVA